MCVCGQVDGQREEEQRGPGSSFVTLVSGLRSPTVALQIASYQDPPPHPPVSTFALPDLSTMPACLTQSHPNASNYPVVIVPA